MTHMPKIGEEKCAYLSCEFARRLGCLCCGEKHENLMTQKHTTQKLPQVRLPSKLPPLHHFPIRRENAVMDDLKTFGITLFECHPPSPEVPPEARQFAKLF